MTRYAVSMMFFAFLAICATRCFAIDPQPWNSTDHSIDGWDWSLPPDVEAHPSSAIKINESKLGGDLPCRLLRSVSTTWRELEPSGGQYEFDALRERILRTSNGEKYAIELHVRASVWELRWFPEEAEYPSSWPAHAESSASAPRWLAPFGMRQIEMKKHGLDNIGTPFQVVNLDIYHPKYHEYYIRMVKRLGESQILQMPEVDYVYLHIMSSSRGEEGTGPRLDDPNRPLFEERLQTWAAAAEDVERKLCLVSNQERDLRPALELGMGQRNGFVEMYSLHVNNEMLGQHVDENGYLIVDETCPLIAENRASGDENEEYVPVAHIARFGPVEHWPHRYRESMLRALQMRRNFLWAEGGPRLMEPDLLCYVALELGRSVDNAPDAWTRLRECRVIDGNPRREPLTVKNFERWLYQRDAEGCRTVACEQVETPRQRVHHPDHMYDMSARRTDVENGQDRISFAVDDQFLSGGSHSVIVKITYVDRNNARWALVYETSDGEMKRKIKCSDTGDTLTATFVLEDARFTASNYDEDFSIQAESGDAVVQFVRLIKRDEIQ